MLFMSSWSVQNPHDYFALQQLTDLLMLGECCCGSHRSYERISYALPVSVVFIAA